MVIAGNKNKVHPYLVKNRSNKTRAKLGFMMYKSVDGTLESEKFLELGSIVQLCKEFKISTRTLHKYLPGNIHSEIEGVGKKKLVILHEADIINIRELIKMYKRFKWLTESEQMPVKYVLEFMSKMMPI